MLSRTTTVLVVFMLAACGGDDTSTPDGGPDASVTDAPSNNDVVNPSDSGGGDVTPGTDASTDGPTSDGAATVMCGTGTCPLPAESCCVGGGGTPTYTCTGGDAGTCQQGEQAMQCYSNDDCPSNKVCCLDVTNDPGSAACATTCGGGNRVIICDPKLTASQNRCGDASACATNNDNSWQLNNKVSGTCGNAQGPY